MIRMTKQTDYGIVILTQFVVGAAGQTTYTARELAEGTRVPLPTVSKILKLLSQEGLLVSQRGVKGGYRLARRPEAISIAEIVRALEGGVAMTECVWAPGDCQHEPTCDMRHNWYKINDVVQEALGKISLVDMASPLPDQFVPLDKMRFGANIAP